MWASIWIFERPSPSEVPVSSTHWHPPLLFLLQLYIFHVAEIIRQLACPSGKRRPTCPRRANYKTRVRFVWSLASLYVCESRLTLTGAASPSHGPIKLHSKTFENFVTRLTLVINGPISKSINEGQWLDLQSILLCIFKCSCMSCIDVYK